MHIIKEFYTVQPQGRCIKVLSTIEYNGKKYNIVWDKLKYEENILRVYWDTKEEWGKSYTFPIPIALKDVASQEFQHFLCQTLGDIDKLDILD